MYLWLVITPVVFVYIGQVQEPSSCQVALLDDGFSKNIEETFT